MIHMSNFRPVKRVDDVIRVFARVRKEIPAVLVMVGDGVEQSNAQYQVEELGLTDAVFFVGMVEKVENYLSVADLMLLPSTTESFGLAALEAMACGVPVVATKVGGLPELILEGETGHLYPVGDVEAMAAGVLDILAAGKLDEFRSNARQRAADHYSAEQVVPLYEAYYQEIIDRGPST